MREQIPYDGEDFVLGPGWSVQVHGPASRRVAERMVEGDNLLGCQDGFPHLPIVEQADGPAVLMATLDEADHWELPQGWSLQGQAYAVLPLHEPGRVLLLGATEQALHYAALGFVQNTERELDCDWPFHPPRTATWTPVSVLDRPDNEVRMGFAAFKGEQDAHFLPNIVYAGLGTCETPEDTERFWKKTLECDPDKAACAQVHRRLDTLVAGRFTHALDEGHPFQVSQSLQQDTGCDGGLIYAELRSWLEERQVALIPTAYGLEARTPDTPIGGSRVPQELPSELWGQHDGDISLSEGLGVERTMRVCAVAERLFLAPSCEALDAEGRVTGPLDLARVDVDTTMPGERSNHCDPGQICQVKPDCWAAVPGINGMALRPDPSCSNPALRVLLPTQTRPGQLLALSFLARVPEVRDLSVKVITRGPEGITPAQDVWPVETSPEEYLDLLDDDTERFSVIVRVPQEGDWASAYVQLLGLAGSGLLLDDLVLEEVDGRLAALDPLSVWVEGLEPACLRVEAGWSPPLRPAPWRDIEGAMALPLASIEVDSSCAAEGEDLLLHYRSFAPAGLWPNLAVRQKAWTWTPDSLNPDFWAHPWSPREQNPEDAPLLLVSDLGGEVRGVGRDGQWPPDERLADLVCRIVDPDCPSDAMCDCSQTEAPLLLAADMYTPWHNGARGHTQVPFGGFVGDTWTARRRLPSSALYLAWWHYDALRVGQPVGGHEQMLGMVRDFASDGLRVIGASAWDPDTQRAWSAAAAGGWTAGTAHYGWGSEEQAPAVMLNAGALAWSPGVTLEEAWSQTPDEAWTAEGMSLQDHTLSWPLAGTWQHIDDAEARWSVDSEGTGWVRLFVDLPEGCELRVGGVVVEHNSRWEALGAPVEGELEVDLLGCEGGVLDEVALYRTLPTIDFPRPWGSEDLADWTSEDPGDPRYKVCGDGLEAACVGSSWPQTGL